MISVGVLGSAGRMGQGVTRLLKSEFAKKAQLGAAADRGEALDALLQTDVVIDFSLPEAMLGLVRAAAAAPGRLPAFVIGSTGWKLDQRRELEELAKRTPVLTATNFSTGVMALLEIVRQASPMLEKLGYTASIVETHHKHKKDAPSGTAISLQRAIAPAGPGNVQTHSVRAGEVIGDHAVSYHGPGDLLSFAHSAQDRLIFARGAIEAALWLAGKPAGMVPVETFFKERYLK